MENEVRPRRLLVRVIVLNYYAPAYRLTIREKKGNRSELAERFT